MREVVQVLQRPINTPTSPIREVAVVWAPASYKCGWGSIHYQPLSLTLSPKGRGNARWCSIVCLLSPFLTFPGWGRNARCRSLSQDKRTTAPIPSPCKYILLVELHTKPIHLPRRGLGRGDDVLYLSHQKAGDNLRQFLIYQTLHLIIFVHL